MDPKKTLIRPEKTVEADEKKAAAEAATAAEEELLQQHYEHIESFVKEVEKNPETIESFVEEVEKNPEVADVVEKEMSGALQITKEMVTKFPGIIKAAFAILSGKPQSSEQNSKFREQGASFRQTIKERLIKWIAADSPEERERIANYMRKKHGGHHSEATEATLRELNIIDSEEPSEQKSEQEKEGA